MQILKTLRQIQAQRENLPTNLAESSDSPKKLKESFRRQKDDGERFGTGTDEWRQQRAAIV